MTIKIKEFIDTNWNKYESALIILFVLVEVGDHTMDYTSLSLSLSLSVAVYFSRSPSQLEEGPIYISDPSLQ